MKRNDWILAVGILLAACIAGFFFYGNRLQGKYVLVQVDGEEYGRYHLNEDQVIDIHHTNRLTIQDGKASMTYADCPDQICVNTAPVGESHELIVCMPNRITVEVQEN